jgi:hypothetical protein
MTDRVGVLAEASPWASRSAGMTGAPGMRARRGKAPSRSR